MRHLAAATLAATMLLATAAPAMAHPEAELIPTMPTDLTHFRTDNVDYLGRFPEHTGTASGRQVGDTFFLTDPRGVFAYDVSDPADPALLGALAVPQSYTGVALAQEDVETDGNILILDAAHQNDPLNRLTIVDVSDPTSMSVISTVDVASHTWTCVSDEVNGELVGCAFAYGRDGQIVDMRDPANAALMPFTWRQQVGYGNSGNSPYTHDLTELRPGLTMTAGADAILMDTRNPINPVRLAAIEGRSRFSSLGYHSLEWAQGGSDRWVIAGTEIAPSSAGSDCSGDDSVIETWDASQINAAMDIYLGDGEDANDPSVFNGAEFVLTDSYQVTGRELYSNGGAPGHVLYCAHWMEYAPDFADSGRVAISYYDRGTRFVEVGEDGMISELGWMTPIQGYSGSPQWISNDIVYVMDYTRGLEILRLNPAAATGVVNASTDMIAAASTGVSPVYPIDGEGFPLESAALALLGLTVAAVEVSRRRRATI